ncbi:MAG: tRNA uridine-5-carboxymethylaminomethyl(34) synthesis enzyme MnmG [Bacteroidales bacterium]|nr:MAG: tRNA uridine-5-carboxymethylaminomethyl(34) synthesis enzyme MnmG [Bacteroidales bacterium]
MINNYDIIVVGGGHAGCEAAAAAANLGSQVLLISMDLTKLAQMSCNPAIGGVGKGQIVREIDALGGYTAKVADLTTIHFRMLNTSKGAAMWSPRAQCDRMMFSVEWRKQLEAIKNLYLLQDEVIKIDIAGKFIKGVFTKSGNYFTTKALILTNGTFLNGLIHIGKTSFQGGRIGELPSNGLSDQLREIGFEVGRMKTGTPARIDGRSVDFSKLIEQKSDILGKFSFNCNITTLLKGKSCFIAHTNKAVHEELKKGFSDSPLFSGKIKGVGPRYCPSIEDKVHTFWQKESHQLFLEPDGDSTYEMYLNGFSSSLPIDIQLNALKLIEGFENVRILRPGYAIEYDFFQPTQLYHTLESKIVPNLYFAGQVNGTTGYEEAAGQGIIAGINAHLKINEKKEFVVKRDVGYIGVMIDDLVTKGVDEPYRVFTSRAEFRILIRQDNADERLTPLGYLLGLISEQEYFRFQDKYRKIDELSKFINSFSIEPSEINPFLLSVGSAEISQKKKIKDILLRPEVFLLRMIKEVEVLRVKLKDFFEVEIIESAEIKIKYKGYIEKERLFAEKYDKYEHITINPDFDYLRFESLSTEARQKLSRIKPQTIGEAQRIPGVSPSDINVLLVYFGR